MNKRIRKLAERAGLKVESFMTNPPKPFQILGTPEQFEKFAEVIIADAINTVEKRFMGDLNREDMEVRRCVADLKQHFGVEK